MKYIKENFLQKVINDCIEISKIHPSITINPQIVKDNEYYLNITYNKILFPSVNNILPDIEFILHLTHNYPVNSPKLYCLTSLSKINLEICDAKDILDDVLQKKWNDKIKAKDIILIIPNFINNFLEKKISRLFIGKYILDAEYDYNILKKIHSNYFNIVEQIINVRTYESENRLLMITDLFFLLFSYKSGIFNYNEVKLVFFSSIKSVFSMNYKNGSFVFEFSKTNKTRQYIWLITNDGNTIMDLVMNILKNRGISYSANMYNGTTSENIEESKKLPKTEKSDN